MPIYEYRCQDCGKVHEFIQKFSDAPKTECPECGGRLEKLISNTSFVLKGSGWYVTDYASGDRKNKMEAEKGKVKSDSKPKSKPKPKSDNKSGGDKAKASAT
jgi:putative FmdB family regulatory protein